MALNMTIIVVIIVVIVGFFLTREFWCWYFKINEKIELLKSINYRLGSMSYISEKQYHENTKANKKEKPQSTGEGVWYCEKCGCENSPDDNVCKNCGGLKSKIMI